MSDVLPSKRCSAGFGWGASIGTLGGLIGLVGAEFRLPVLVGRFRFPTLEAVILNKVTSLAVVAASLPLRGWAIPWSAVGTQWAVVINLLGGSLAGAWLGAHYATRMKAEWLNRVIFVLLVGLALGMLFGHHHLDGTHAGMADSALRWAAGLGAGLAIGAVAAVLGVAGGELIIPTLVLLFGIDIKLAGSLSLCISLPTMLMAFARYRQSDAFTVCSRERRFLGWMIGGSLAGSAIGAFLLGIVPTTLLVWGLGVILFFSAVKVFRHRH